MDVRRVNDPPVSALLWLNRRLLVGDEGGTLSMYDLDAVTEQIEQLAMNAAWTEHASHGQTDRLKPSGSQTSRIRGSTAISIHEKRGSKALSVEQAHGQFRLPDLNRSLSERHFWVVECGPHQRQLAGHWPDREVAISLNRMRCRTNDGETWTTVRVRDMRERLGISEYDPTNADVQMISLMKAAERLGICVGSVKSLVLKGILPATQIMPGSSWLVPVEALTSEAVRIGVQGVIARRPQFYEQYQYDKLIRLPGI
jgi:hypothetical protein